jgi:hypothetical protein
VGIGLPLAWTALSGKSAWEKTQAALRARGEKLTFDEFAHPLPPPARNFFADPLWTKFTASIQTSPGNNFVIFPPALPAGSPSLDDLDKPPAISLLKIAEIILPADQQSNLSISMKAPYFSNTVSRVLPKTTDPATRRMLATFVVAGLTGNNSCATVRKPNSRSIIRALPGRRSLTSRVFSLSQKVTATWRMRISCSAIMRLPRLIY